MMSCLLRARCLSAWKGHTAWLMGLLPVPPLRGIYLGSREKRIDSAVAFSFFGRENWPGKWGVKGAQGFMGLAEGGVLLEPWLSSHRSWQLSWASPPVSNLSGLSVSSHPCFAISAQQ